MRPLMQPESLLDRESLVTDVALVGHFARVRPHVNGQTSHLHELSTAHAALVRFVARVFAGVLLHVVFAGKGLAAVGAFESLNQNNNESVMG